ncbi:ubiquinone biosynthesis monooxygenase COQ6, mitochondrial-like [Ruditapes philippinarum]|uniref:ubiquinone biosynthesis monooxygenase COQ6, mitochondrial-like n=1 Tax=Ruditapes philippinarum TaxID=129788 RepID=UPI00295AD467|nr:ubiquinone biosynthesis monooxygenase COQ6, mitochondrial-like [Ruditapes philippinarum]
MATKLFTQKCCHCLATAKQLRLFRPMVSRHYQTNYGDEQTADIVISGGGMVGASMACALGHESILQNKRIVLLEAAPKKTLILSESYGNRTCTLSPATVQLFEKCDVWSEVEDMRCQKVLRMQVWESCSNSLITFNQENMADELAYVAENDVIQEALTRRLDTLQGRVEVMYKTRVDDIKIPGVSKDMDSNAWVKLVLNNGQTLKTKLLIGSDGMNSSVRKAAQFHTVNFSYNQKAVVAVLNILGTDNNVAWQRFLPTGPIAMLPLSDTVMSLIWTTSPDHAEHLSSLSDESFIDAVNDAYWHDRDINEVANKVSSTFQSLVQTLSPGGTSCRQLPPTVTGVQKGSRASFPLGLTHSSNYVRHRVALVGDAAHRLHPLAGQGVNLGFGDVSKLSEVISRAASDGSDLGTLSYLKEYETDRQRKVLPVIGTIDGLHRLYNTDFTPIVLLRTLGLQAVNALTPLKDKIIEQASKK